MRSPPPGFDIVMARFAAKRRRTLLAQARDMALGDYHNTVQVTAIILTHFLSVGRFEDSA